MPDARIAILDVGHGNCAVLHTAAGLAVFDAGPGSTLNEYLAHNSIKQVEALFISHADADHIGGAIGLLSSNLVKVANVYLNPDAEKGDQFRRFRSALIDATTRFGTRIQTPLAIQTYNYANVSVEVLHPPLSSILSGPGGTDLTGSSLTANNMSAVIRLVVDGRPKILLAADIEEGALEAIRKSGLAMNAEVLVFPHHGGKAGLPDPAPFAKNLCKAVNPKHVLFSIGRGKHNTPNPGIVEVVRKVGSRPRITCTQLSEHCANQIPKTSIVHISPQPAAGREKTKCCAGTIELNLLADQNIFPRKTRHSKFVQQFVPKGLCVRRNKK